MANPLTTPRQVDPSSPFHPDHRAWVESRTADANKLASGVAITSTDPAFAVPPDPVIPDLKPPAPKPTFQPSVEAPLSLGPAAAPPVFTPEIGPPPNLDPLQMPKPFAKDFEQKPLDGIPKDPRDFIEPGTGSTIHGIHGDPRAISKQYDAAGRQGGIEGAKAKHDIAEDVVGHDLLSSDVHEAVVTPGPAESIFRVFEPIDMARRYAWWAAMWGASMLPEPTEEGEEPTITSKTGDYLQKFSGRLMGNLVEASFGDVGKVTDAPYIGLKPVIAVADALWSTVKDEDGGRIVDKIGENLYAAVTDDDELLATFDKPRGYEWGIPGIDIREEKDKDGKTIKRVYDFADPWGIVPDEDSTTPVEGWRSVFPMGIDLVDAALPPELAMELAEHSETEAAKMIYQALSTHLGREAFGIILEILADPLWFMGPAMGSRVIHRGEEAYSLSAPIVRAAAKAAEVSGNAILAGPTSKQKMLDLVIAEGDELLKAERWAEETASKLSDKAGAHAASAERYAKWADDPAKALADAKTLAEAELKKLDDYVRSIENLPDAAIRTKAAAKTRARLVTELAAVTADEATALKYMKTMAARTANHAKVYAADAEQFRRGVAFATAARKGGVAASVKEAAGMGIPFFSNAWHIPFTDIGGFHSKWASKAGARVVATGTSVIPRVMVRSLGKAVDTVADAARPFTREALNAKLSPLAKSVPLNEALTAAERIAFVPIQLGWKAGNMARGMFGMLAKTLGTRWIQPMVTRVMTDAHMAGFGAIQPFGHFGDKQFQRLQRVPPEIWENYQHAVSTFLDRLTGDEAKLMHRFDTATREAKGVWRRRRSIAKAEIGKTEREIENAKRALALSSNAADKMVQQERINSLASRLEQQQRWASKNYSIDEVMAEAWDRIDRGSGQVNDSLSAVIGQLDGFRHDVATKYSINIDEVNQALAAMARWAKGDTNRAVEVRGMLDEIHRTLKRGGYLDSILARGINQLELAASHRLLEVRAWTNLVGEISPEKLATILERIQQTGNGPLSPGMERVIRDLVLEIMDGDQVLTERVFNLAAQAMGHADGEQALRFLSDMVWIEGEKGPGRTVVQVIKSILGEWEKEAKFLSGLAKGGVNVKKEGELLESVLGSRASRQLSMLRARIGAADWGRFQKWVRDESLVAKPPEAWAQARKEWDQIEVLAEMAQEAAAGRVSVLKGTLNTAGIEGGSLGKAGKLDLMVEHFRRAVEDAQSPEEIVRKLRTALDDLFDTSDPVMAKVADGMAERMADRLAKGRAPLTQASEARAMAGKILRGLQAAEKKTINAELAAHKLKMRGMASDTRKLMKENRAAFEQELREVTPRFVIPKEGKDGGRPTSRSMAKWEEEMFRHVADIRERYALSESEMLQVAFATLRLGPHPEFMRTQYEDITKRYGQMVGTRFDAMDPDMAPIVLQLREVVASYEELYAKFGFTFMKDPVARMRDWGVIGYTPHIATDESLAAKGKDVLAELHTSGELPPAVSTLDARLSQSMDAGKLRTLRGTISELQKSALNSGLSYSTDTDLIIARYTQSTRAIGAKEFLLGLIHGKVARRMEHAEAQAADYVPLFHKAKTGEKQGFARWMDTIPEVAQDNAIENLLARLPAGTAAPDAVFIDRISVFALNQKLVTLTAEEAEMLAGAGVDLSRLPPELYLDGRVDASFFRSLFGIPDSTPVGKGIQYVRQRIWNGIAAELNPHAGPIGSGGKRVQGDWLAQYYETEDRITDLFVPRGVHQSMEDILTLKKSAFAKSMPIRAITRIQNFLKMRFTAVHVAFNARNAVSNNISNFLGIGIAETLSPTGTMMASRINMASIYADKFGGGSLHEAYRVLREGKADAGFLAGIEDAERLVHLQTFKALGLRSFIDEGMDLGDGLLRNADEALDTMRSRGVQSGSYTQFVDIEAFERGLAESMMSSSIAGKTLSLAEDAYFLLFPMLMANGLIVPVSMPKAWGATMAQLVENNARILHFRSVLKTSGSVEDAAASVNKFLFNYGDLTPEQKSFMKLLFPWFTWTQKNILLQIEMMKEQPALYSKFRQILLEAAPDLAEDLSSDDEFIIHTDRGTPEEMWNRSDYTLSKLRFPLGDDFFVEGTGTPMESFVEQLGLISSSLDIERSYSEASSYGDNSMTLRMAGQVNFLLKFVAEQAIHKNFYYNRDFKDLTNPALIAEYIAGVARIPLIGGILGSYMEELTGYEVVGLLDKGSGSYVTDGSVAPRMNHFAASIPWTVTVRNASALTDLYLNSYGQDLLLARELGLDMKKAKIDRFWRWAAAYTGLRLAHDNPEVTGAIRSRHLQTQMEAEQKARGAIWKGSKARVRTKLAD